jgi:hypothetical protein
MDISMNYLDNITLEYFTNKSQYETIFKKTEPTIQKKFSSDKRFYKKRLIDLTKKLLKDEINNMQLVNIFNEYIKNCINYLEFLDKSDVMQDKYDKTVNNNNDELNNNELNNNELNNNELNNNELNNNELNNNELNNNERTNSMDDIIIDSSENMKNNVDNLLFKKEEVKKVNLDNFIIKKNSVEKPKILPKKEIINVREKKYKTKGIKEGKEEKKNKK